MSSFLIFHFRIANAITSRANAMASMPVSLRPPWVKICQCPAPVRLASMATTMHWLPNFSAACAYEVAIVNGGGVDRYLVGAGQQQAADILDAPARRRRR